MLSLSTTSDSFSCQIQSFHIFLLSFIAGLGKRVSRCHGQPECYATLEFPLLNKKVHYFGIQQHSYFLSPDSTDDDEILLSFLSVPDYSGMDRQTAAHTWTS